ncbi:Superfamily II DNA or RNA helicase, SNF2 family [Geosmithia morbida]|uniref:Superfamily II DNA or RNA helicase, SNF2 family n=1 Tax=Geosmithia morbida TaxID=1094350 RepID=A0A9P4YZE9_9HYPO|nr:Superfamily II DNA or RNA helicase, SNF2 family [Geosmithia morbida]KAF4124468.1 Superfamily II DNA or RNA helicase, SNF2 family [Geosmithia morbida]
MDIDFMLDPSYERAFAGPSGSLTRAPEFPLTEVTFSDSGSVSLPSRKRERTSTQNNSVDLVHKSRRTTSPSSWTTRDPFSTPTERDGSGALDYIDLTGGDEVSKPDVFRQSREAARYEQEEADRKMALQLSSQAPFWSDQPFSTNPNDVFHRLMATQQLNYGPADTRRESEPPSDNLGSHSNDGPRSGNHDLPRDGTSATRGDPTMQMPGSYNASWHDPEHTGLPHNPSWARGRGAPMGWESMLPVSLESLPGEPPLGRADGTDRHQSSSDNLERRFPAGGGFRHPSGAPWGSMQPASDRLSSVINRTSQFDFVNGTDGSGNALPERVTDYLHDIMHDSRVTEKELDDLLQNIRPDMEIPEKNRNGTPEGLKGTLYYHQELALTWLKSMEEGTNKGGILADDMGLGKTISVISLMLVSKATSRPKTNLVVAPLALVRQWEEEIKTKVKAPHRLSTFIYHQKKATTEDLLKYDVVLTTYGTLAAELKRLEKLQEEDRERRVNFNDKAIAEKCPLLHPTKANFHRIILDEAQCIKNQKSQTSRAACRLQGTHRWCLTGTPMMNGVVELFALLQFLKIKPYCHWDIFRQTFGTLFGKKGEPRGQAMKRLRTILKAIMLRRKKDSQLDGKPILRLPSKTETQVHVELSADELDFYKQLESKSQVLFNKYLREGTVGKNYSNILVLLLRLRQACCHPHLNLDVEESSEASTADMIELVKKLDQSIVTRIKEIDAFECPICYDAVQSPSFFIPCGHDSCKQCLSRLVDSNMEAAIRQGNESSRCRCPVCRGEFDPRKCFTYEAFREIHMPQAVETQDEAKVEEVADSEDDDDSGSDFDSEADSNADDVDSNGNLWDFIVDDEDGEDSKDAVLGREVSSENKLREGGGREKFKKKNKKKRGKGKGKDEAEEVKPTMLKTLRKEAYKNRETYRKYMAYLRKTWLPSAKVTETMKLLRQIEDGVLSDGNHGPEKTIIFSQWTFLLDLLEVAMRHEGFSHRPQRYDGSMSATQRNDAAHAFRSKADVRVILVSLRAGNAGLNLTAASRVIILDPFWNPYIEMQAIDRAYRIGQSREVVVYRILTTDTVEDRIVELQERKKEMVEAALDESESRKIGRLSTKELRFLFNGTR